MQVEIAPARLDASPGIAQVVAVTVTNTSRVIGGYTLRVLGADPSWVHIEDDEVSLFPDETRTMLLELSVPAGLPVGERTLSVQVRELTPPHDTELLPLVLVVPAAPGVEMRADPLAVTAGRRARVGLLITNTGNTNLDGTLHGQDPEDKVAFAFEPAWVTLPPGQNTIVEMKAKARRPFAGSPVVRPLELRLLDAEQQVALARSAAPVPPPAPLAPGPDGEPAKAPRTPLADRLPGRRPKPPRPRVDDDVAPLAQATFVQRPLVSRGSMSLVGLAVALTVFAVVITIALSTLVGQSAADRDLALKVAAARDSADRGGGSTLEGKVSQLTNGDGAPNINVTVFSADDTLNPLAATVTDDKGLWTVGDLASGDYKARFQGAGFSELWYPAALTAADGEVLTVGPGETTRAEGAALGGVPASIAGTVEGDDVAGAVLTLKTSDAPAAGTTTTSTAGTPALDAVRQEATVRTLPIASDGSFSLVDVPSPQTYDLLVEKKGYAASVQTIDVAGGEERTGVAITLRQGDGVVRGRVQDADGTAVPDASIVASVAETAVSSRSQSGTGNFVLEALPTPSVLTVVISKDGYTSQTQTVSLEPGQQISGLKVTLAKSSGEVGGRVRLASNSRVDEFTPSAGGVLVTITDGTTTVRTATRTGSDAGTGDDGEWLVDSLPVPGDYTVTFQRDDLRSQTVALSLDANGVPAAGSTVDVTMSRATGTIYGSVAQRRATGSGTDKLGEATVQLVSNDATYSVVSASGPDKLEGAYQFDSVPPGTYTLQASRRGVAPVTRVVRVTLGDGQRQAQEFPLVLNRPASLTVTVNGGAAGYVVELYRASDYPDDVYATEVLGRDTGGGRKVRFDDIDAPLDYVVQVRRSRGGPVVANKDKRVNLSQPAELTITVGETS